MASPTGGPDTEVGVVDRALDALGTVAPDDVARTLAEVASSAGFDEATIYLADLQQDVLLPWQVEGREPERIDSTIAGRAFRRGVPVEGGEATWWFPIIDGGDRLGVLRLSHADGAPPDDLSELGRRLAGLVALVITSRRLRTDRIDLTCRTRAVSLAAEARWALLPPRTLSAPELCVSGHLEPAYEIAGDSYDYALNGDVLDLAVFDAMGHGLIASRLANSAVIGYRHGRRQGLDLPDLYRMMDEAIETEFGDGMFVTAQLARLQISTGVLSVVNAGHPRPLLIRNGAAHPMDLRPATPIGLGTVEADVGEVALEPGDAVLILSDGVTEAHSAGGDVFGAGRVGDLAARAVGDGESIPETVRRLVESLLEHRSVGLEDDATFVMLCWRPPSPAGEGG